MSTSVCSCRSWSANSKRVLQVPGSVFTHRRRSAERSSALTHSVLCCVIREPGGTQSRRSCRSRRGALGVCRARSRFAPRSTLRKVSIISRNQLRAQTIFWIFTVSCWFPLSTRFVTTRRSSEVQSCVGVAFLPAASSLPGSPSLLQEAGEDVEETLVDSSAPSSLSPFVLRLLLTFFCLRALLHCLLQLHLQGGRRTSGEALRERCPPVEEVQPAEGALSQGPPVWGRTTA